MCRDHIHSDYKTEKSIDKTLDVREINALLKSMPEVSIGTDFVVVVHYLLLFVSSYFMKSQICMTHHVNPMSIIRMQN